jgi:stringent starvation protein B
MSVTDSSLPEPTSTKPYMLRAIYEWCTDNGYTPYVAVFVNGQVVVPREYVKNGEIVLNVSFDATQGLKIGNDAITFKARFSGIARDIFVPVENVVAVYARENGQGMAFPLSPALQQEQIQGEPPAAAKPSAPGLRLAPTGGEASEGNSQDSHDSQNKPQREKTTSSAGPATQTATQPTSIKSARSSRKPKLASTEPSATENSATEPINTLSKAKLIDANKPRTAGVTSVDTPEPSQAPAAGASPADAGDDREPTPPQPPRPTLKRVK